MANGEVTKQDLQRLEQQLTALSRAVQKNQQDQQAFRMEHRRHKHDDIGTYKMDDEIVTVLMSFETNLQTATKIYFPYAVQIRKIRGIVMKAIAGTDAGTITGANSAGNSTGGQITAAASDPLNTEYSVTPSDNNKVGKDDYYKLTSAKTTAGGEVLVTLEFTRL